MGILKNQVLLLAISSLLFGCVTMPESEREIREGEAEQVILKDIEFSEIEIELPAQSLHSEQKVLANKSLAEVYRELEFNPNGRSLRNVALRDPIAAFYAKNIRDEALALTALLYPNNEAVDNEADAFRHAYFSCRLAQQVGKKRAKVFTDAYEISAINKIGSRCMDLYNNREGRKLSHASNANFYEKQRQAKEAVQNAIQSNKLMLEPFRIKLDEKN